MKVEKPGILLLFVLLGIFISLLYVISKPIFFDEAFSLFTVSHGVRGIFSVLQNDSAPPLYYLLLLPWKALFGIGQISARLLSVLFYLLSIWMVFIITQKLNLGKKEALLSAALFSLSPVAIHHAVNTRNYSLESFLVLSSIFLFFQSFHLEGQPRRKRTLSRISYSIVLLLGLLTHYWFLFVLFSQFLGALLLERGRRRSLILHQAVSLAAFLLLWFPVFLRQFELGAVGWLTRPSPSFLYESYRSFLGSRKIFFLFSGIFLLGLFWGKRPWHDAEREKFKNLALRREIQFLVLFSFAPLFVAFLVSQVKPVYLVGSYDIVSLGPTFIILGVLMARFQPRLFQFLLLLLVLVGVARRFQREARAFTWKEKETAQFLLDNAEDGDVLIFTCLSRVTVEYYLNLLGSKRNFRKFTYPSDYEKHPGWRDIKRTLSEPERLEEEAQAMVSALDTLKFANLWLFYGVDNRVNDFLKRLLDRNLLLVETLNLSGFAYKKILKYKPLR